MSRNTAWLLGILGLTAAGAWWRPQPMALTTAPVALARPSACHAGCCHRHHGHRHHCHRHGQVHT
ncbi:MAG TPA: hypothetical protein VGO93_28995 [Candidatus Xenobia bacterium]